LFSASVCLCKRHTGAERDAWVLDTVLSATQLNTTKICFDRDDGRHGDRGSRSIKKRKETRKDYERDGTKNQTKSASTIEMTTDMTIEDQDQEKKQENTAI